MVLLKECIDGQVLVLESMSRAIQAEALSADLTTKDTEADTNEDTEVLKNTQDHTENTIKAERDHIDENTEDPTVEKEMMALGLSKHSNQDHIKEAR